MAASLLEKAACQGHAGAQALREGLARGEALPNVTATSAAAAEAPAFLPQGSPVAPPQGVADAEPPEASTPAPVIRMEAGVLRRLEGLMAELRVAKLSPDIQDRADELAGILAVIAGAAQSGQNASCPATGEQARKSLSPPTATSAVVAPPLSEIPSQRQVDRLVTGQEGALRQAQEAGKPFLLAGAMPQVTGDGVLNFMQQLMSSLGSACIGFEVQDVNGERKVDMAPLMLYIQELERCAPSALLAIITNAGNDSSIEAFLEPPALSQPDLLPTLPPALRPSCGTGLVIGSKGAKCQLHRDPVVWCGWNTLLLGRKRWRLWPPSTTPSALQGDASGACGAGSSPADGFESGWQPAEVWEATQEMGETLVIPPGWWHQTLHEDRTLALMGQFMTEIYQSGARRELARWLGEPLERTDVLELAAHRVASDASGLPGREATLKSGSAAIRGISN